MNLLFLSSFVSLFSHFMKRGKMGCTLPKLYLFLIIEVLKSGKKNEGFSENIVEKSNTTDKLNKVTN